jgi:hypothetical protein
MDVLGPVLGVLGVAAFLVWVTVAGGRAERWRLERIRLWAASNGWTVTERPAVDWAARLGTGDVDVLVSGTASGRPVGVAEFTWKGGEDSTTYLVVTVRLDVAYPPLGVVSRGALSRLGRKVFGDDATATGHGAFDRQFRVQTGNPALARTLLGPALIAEHLAGRIPTWSLAGQDLLTWEYGQIEDPNKIVALAAPLVRVAELLDR